LFSEKSSEEQSSGSSAPEPAPAKLVESKRLKLFLSCIASYKENFATDLYVIYYSDIELIYNNFMHAARRKGTLAEIYGPVFEDNPRYLEKVQKACEETCVKGFDKKVSKFIESNELDKKLKELEEIAEDPVPGVEKAWYVF
jgi:hypothetical protein